MNKRNVDDAGVAARAARDGGHAADHHVMTIKRMKNYVDKLRGESDDIGHIVDLDADMESLNCIMEMLEAARESEGGEAVVQVDCFPCWSRLELIGETDKDCPECAGVGHYFETVRTAPQPDKWIKITPAMIEAGAQRLVRWDENSTWPDSWPAMDIAAARQDAERVIRSALSTAEQESE